MERVFSKLAELLKRTALSIASDDAALKKLGITEKELAVAVILVDLALVDADFDIDEHMCVIEKLKEMFGIGLDECYALLEQARQIVAAGGKADAYAAFLKQSLTAADREGLVRTFDELLAVDHKSAPFEIALRNRYEKLLGVRVKHKSV